MPDLTPEERKRLEELEQSHKEDQEKQQQGGTPPQRGRPNPRLDPADSTPLGLDDQGRPNPEDRVAGAPDLDALRQSAILLLTIFLDQGQRSEHLSLARALVPSDRDFDLAFRPEVADTFRQAYRSAFPRTPVPEAHEGQQNLLFGLAYPHQFAPGGLFADRFPGGYQRLAEHLDPDRPWAVWKFVRPGERHGMAYDGLVWLENHWAWIPKPWRLIPG